MLLADGVVAREPPRELQDWSPDDLSGWKICIAEGAALGERRCIDEHKYKSSGGRALMTDTTRPLGGSSD